MIDWKGCGRKLTWLTLGIRLEGLKKTTKITVRMIGLRAEISTRDLPDTKQEC
jgi:hypothetical protein